MVQSSNLPQLRAVIAFVKAIRVERTGGPDVLQRTDIEKPTPKAGEALVKITAIGINYIDIYIRTGMYPSPLPYTPGGEAAGVIEEVGKNDFDLKVGDRVAYMGSGSGSYAQYNCVAVDKLVPIPHGIDDQIACAAMLQGVTAQYLSHSTYPIQRGDTVVVHAAAGGVGNLLVQLAKARGATVVATASTPEKRSLAVVAGADAATDYDGFVEKVKELTGGEGAACVYDSVGMTTFDDSLRALAPRGYMVLYGAASGPVPPIAPQALAAAGSLFLTRPTAVHFTRTRAELLARAHDIFEHIAKKSLNVRVGATYPLADAARAHTDLAARATTGKLILLP